VVEENYKLLWRWS